MITRILGRAGSGKTARIFSEIAGHTARREGGLILLVPEQYSHEAERELCAAAGDGLSACAEVLSFTGLARKVFADCGGARPRIDGGGRLLCMAAAMDAVGGALTVYSRGRREPKLLAELLHAADELKNAGLSPEDLARAAAQTEGVLADKLRDLALLLEAFAACQARSGADSADALETLAELIGDSTAAKGRFYVDGFTDFTVLEQRVLEALIAAGAELTVCLTCGRDEEGELFALPRRTARWLEETARAHGQPCRTEWMEPAAEGPIPFYCDHLFSFGAQEAPEVKESIRLVTAASAAEECELAAAELLRLARAGGRWRDMAVAVRGFEDYRVALEAACERYGVPLFTSGRTDILQKSLPLLIASALEAVERGYEYEAMFSYLKTGLAGFEPEELDELENYVILWNIRGQAWDRPFRQHPEGYNREATEESEALLERLNGQRRAIMAPLKALERAGKAASTAAQQAEALADFLLDIELPERLEKRSAALEELGLAETAAEYGRLWDIVCTALEQFAAVLGDMPMEPALFGALFRLMLSQYDVNLIPVSLDRVQAGDMDKMRRRHIRHLLLLGATDERLPAPREGGGVFSAEEREELGGLGFALGSAEEELSREFGGIYNCLSLPSESLYISRPRTDAEGAEARPSMIVERARSLFGLEEQRGDLMTARLQARDSARGLAVLGAAGDPRPEAQAAREYFSRRGEGESVERLARTARQSRGRLSPEAVERLYGRRPSLSASRAEKFNSCRFGYFLQYGLKAKPRQKALFDPRDYGSFLHDVLERTARGAMAEGGFRALSRARVEALAEEAMEDYIHRQLNDFADKSPRFIYLFKRLRRTVKQVAADMWEELSRSDFVPLEMELDLTEPGLLEPDESGGPRLTGRVDRVDGWVKDDVLYLRVTDYKTGVKKFSLSDLCRGMDMQMLLYLFTLQKRGREHFGFSDIRPAGVLYAPVRVTMTAVDCEPDEEMLAELERADTRRSGLVLQQEEVLEAMENGPDKRFIPVRFGKNGPQGDALVTAERFGALSRFIDKTLKELAAELRAGSVEADPWFKNARDNACAFCDYRDACLFDEAGDCRRPVTNLKAAEAWETIENAQI